MRNSIRRVATLFMVLAVALAGVGMAFSGSVAAETTTLAGDGSDQVTGFTANESNSLETTINADGTDFGTDGTTVLKMNVSYNNETYAVTSEDVANSSDASQTVNLSNDELSDLPGDAGENTTVEVTTWGVNADGNVTTATTNFTVDITFDSTYAAVTVDDDSADIEDVEASAWNTYSFGLLGTEDPADLHTYESTVGVDGDNTTITVNDATENGSDAFDEAIDEDIETGDTITGAAVGLDGTPIAAYYDEAPDSVEDGDTYAVYNSDAGTWTITLGDDYSDASEVDVFVSSQSYTDVDSFDKDELSTLFAQDLEMGFMSLQSNFGLDAFTSFNLGDLLPF